jgi:hypothetical protein
MKAEPWSLDRKLSVLQQGGHQSAKQHLDFLCGKFVDMIHKGQWILLPAHMVLSDPNLRLGPLGVVPQLGRRPRTICDYSFFCVNDETIDMAPAESMQFGRALSRILQSIARFDPRLGPVFLAKIDVDDAFYRIAIRVADVTKRSVIFPSEAGEEPLVALPLVFPVGWKESPPVLTSATESVADLANTLIRDNAASVPHHLDAISEPDIPLEHCPVTAPQGPPSLRLPRAAHHCHHRHPRPVKHWEAYVDDFIGMVQGSTTHRRHVKRLLLDSLDKFMR